MIKNFLIIILLFFIILSYNYVGNSYASKFSKENLLQTFPEKLESRGQLDPQLLEQPFSFLGEGAQCYVFASRDGNYVIKLFKARHFKPQKKWLSEGPLFSSFVSPAKKKQSQHKWARKFQESCERYVLAFDQLRDETALEFLHLEKSATSLPVNFQAAGKTYTLDLATLPFILQKKGELVPHTLSKLLEQGAREAAKEKLLHLRELLIERARKGITDPRQCFSVNFGFIGNKPIQFDVGKITHDPALDTEKEIARTTSNLDQWVENHFPELKEKSGTGTKKKERRN
jgi:hypothetical protein